MNRPEFERELARLREQIADLPASQREALEALARETAERHEQIRRSALEGHRAVERLEMAFEHLDQACTRLRERALDLRDALARSPGRPEPGLN